MDRWFNVIDKPPYNNKEVLSYFFCRLLVEIIMGLYANYFGIEIIMRLHANYFGIEIIMRLHANYFGIG